jgi:hypothetical protein
MGVTKFKYSKISKVSDGLPYDIRFDFNLKAFIITKGKRRLGKESFNNPKLALEYIKNKLS